MDWFNLISLIFGTGGVGYAVVNSIINKKKYEQEVRDAQAEADLKGDEFWKQRYDVLQKEVQTKDDWWKERYDGLYNEYQNERKLSNEVIRSFRNELTEMRNDYESQRNIEKAKYDTLMKQYISFKEESERRELEYKNRISQLEKIIDDYEKRLS